MRVIVADAELSVRLRIKQLLMQSGSAIKVVGEASHDKQALALTSQLYPDALFLESGMLDQSSQLLGHLSKLRRVPAVILMSQYQHQNFAHEAPIVACFQKPLTKQDIDTGLRQAVLFQTSQGSRPIAVNESQTEPTPITNRAADQAK